MPISDKLVIFIKLIFKYIQKHKSFIKEFSFYTEPIILKNFLPKYIKFIIAL